MKIVQALGWYFPESSGGTEVYVSGLARGLVAAGCDVIIAAPRDGDVEATYRHDGIDVYRYPVSTTPSRDEAAGIQPPAMLDRFQRWLDEQAPDVYHQHGWTRGCGVHHLQAAHDGGIPTVTTLHVPAAVCLRDTMLLDGESICDGRIEVARCTRCWGRSRGIPMGVSALLGQVPAGARLLSGTLPEGVRLQTAAMTPALVEAHRARFERLVSASDRIVVVCEWLRAACLINGAPADKLVMSRQGVDDRFIDHIADRLPSSRASGPLRIGFLGRLDPVKGVDVIVDSVTAMPASAPVELVIRGLPQDNDYARRITERAARDPRITLAPPVNRSEVASEIERYDLLAIPSRWLETGPLVALEARAAGRPVAASRRGGLAEIVREPEDGWLLPPDDVNAWTALLAKLADDPTLARRLHGPRPVRQMRNVCDEMIAVYDEVATRARADLQVRPTRGGDREEQGSNVERTFRSAEPARPSH
jgi:glycosyltransferase involved in cell wall biosynthesis